MHKLTDSEIEEIKNNQANLLDVRSEEEYRSGHAAHSINRPVDKLNNIDFDKSKKIYLYCAAGGRAQIAENLLSQKGYEAVNIGGTSEAIDAMGAA